MSKSLGNVMDPLDIIDEYGADALRFTNAAMAAPWRCPQTRHPTHRRLPQLRHQTVERLPLCRDERRLGQSHAPRPNRPNPPPPPTNGSSAKPPRTLAEVNDALTAYRFDTAADALYKFVWGSVCDWYVEFAKPLFDGPDAAETRATMAWVLDQCMILLHPFIPFITEDLWGNTGNRANSWSTPIGLNWRPDLITHPPNRNDLRHHPDRGDPLRPRPSPCPRRPENRPHGRSNSPTTPKPLGTKRVPDPPPRPRRNLQPRHRPQRLHRPAPPPAPPLPSPWLA